MNFDSKIYVAGHTGLVGSTIFRKLQQLGYGNIISADEKELDLRRQESVELFFDQKRPEYVFLAAAKVGGIISNNTYKGDFIYDNILIAANIINSAFKFGVKKLLNLGSSCIYPKNAPQPLKEEYLLTGELEPTNEPYAIAKIAAIKLCTSYNFQHGTNFISVMPTNLYGKNDNFNLETSHVMPALIRKMILAKALDDYDFDFIRNDLRRYKIGWGLDKKINFSDNDSIRNVLRQAGVSADNISIWGSGLVRREFLHVEDMADACIYLMNNFEFSEIGDFVNIGTGKDLSIKELVQLIKKNVNYRGELSFDTSKPDGTSQKLLDISRMKSLGWEAKISLDEGIKSAIENYLKD